MGSTKNNASVWTDRKIPYKPFITVKSKHCHSDEISTAMEEIQSKYGYPYFYPRTTETIYLEFPLNATKNSSRVGMPSTGVRKVNIKTKWLALHEIMHAIGFIHEHQRFNRDEYVTVNWENIVDGDANSDFTKISEAPSKNLGKYDFESTMHYPSVNDGTWQCKKKSKGYTMKRISNSKQGWKFKKKLSDGDKVAIGKLYESKNHSLRPVLDQDSFLLRKDSLISPDGSYTLEMQGDGKLGLYDNSQGKHTWKKGTHKTEEKGYRTMLTKQGELRIYDKDNKKLWTQKPKVIKSFPKGWILTIALQLDNSGRLNFFGIKKRNSRTLKRERFSVITDFKPQN